MLRDCDIRAALSKDLLDSHSGEADTLVLEEFGCKAARADLAVINGVMHCYEIKSGADKLSRLPTQIPAYSAVFDRVTLVLEANHLVKAETIIPAWWGITVARRQGEEVSLKKLRKGSLNRRLNPLALAKMLWKDEVSRVARDHNVQKFQTISMQWQAVADGLPLSLLASVVRQAIKARGGSGFRPPLMQSGDSYPRQSSCQHSQDH